ncbi:MAG: alcohol dehydrogenase [Gordonia sp.]|nr:alcohol dehydrogenase [Gordonia sp. (in: high G+C Gram-positive bacteria)]
MRAAVTRSRGSGFEIAELNIDCPRDHEVLVAIMASGLCHSDWDFANSDFGQTFPTVLGHEIAGVVQAVGPHVTQIAPGDHVVGCTVASCGACEHCMMGNRLHCLNPTVGSRRAGDPPRLSESGATVAQAFGLGGFADHAVIHESQLVAVDSAIPFDKAAVLGCSVATGGGVVLRSARVQPMESVVILGAGGVGLNAIQVSALVGARKVIAIDVDDSKLKLARTFGATHVVNSKSEDAVERISRITGGRGVDHAFEMSGLPGPLDQGMAMLGRHGTMYVVGLQHTGTTVDFPAAVGDGLTMRFEHAVRGVKMGSTNFKIDVPYYAELYMQGRLNLDDLVTDTISLDQINKGFARMHSGETAGRTVITFESKNTEKGSIV